MAKHSEIQLTFRFETTSYLPHELALLTPSDIFQNCDQKLLEALKEDKRIDRKSAGIHSGELGEYICCWANTVDGGLVAIGQDNDGQFSGCLIIGTDRLNNLERAADTHCPEAQIETRRVPVKLSNGGLDFVLLVYIHYHPKRVIRDVRSKVYTRIGDTKKEIKNTEQIRAMEIEKGQVDLEQEPVELQYPADFKVALIRQYAHGVKTIKRLDQAHSDEEILVHGRLGKFQQGRFVPNVACTLLFANDPLIQFPGCKVRIQRFDGEIELTGKNFNVVKDHFVEGPIPEVIVEAAKILKTQLREFTRLGDDGRFYTASEYPEDAWYEAIVNACVHRSYVLKTMVTFVKMFDDRLVIESPGGFPPPVTPETIYYTHSPRNPHLMQALFFMDFVKLSNEGTRRIRDTMSAMNLPRPEFAQKEVASGFDSVRVTLRNNIKLRRIWVDAEADSRLGKMATQLNPQELRIVNYVAEHGSINVTQAQKLFPNNRRWHAVKRTLDSLVARGCMIHIHKTSIARDAHAVYRLPERQPE
jgi:ATP-dependent DNA helicase RecG